MKRSVAIIALISLLAPNCFASFLFKRPQGQSLLARVTVYWASGGRGSDRYTRRHKCSTGLRLRTGHCAVDPKQIPYGSNIVFPDGTSFAAVDTGTAVRNRKAARLLGRTVTERNSVVIDRFFETKREALTWANTHPHFMTVRVIRPKPASFFASRGQIHEIRKALATKSSRFTRSSSAGLAGFKVAKIR